MNYTKGKMTLPIQDPNHNPGRERDENLFKSLYGASQSEVEEQLVETRFLGQVLRFNSANQAAESLTRVEKNLLERIKTGDAELADYLFTWNALSNPEYHEIGTYHWRFIKGTNRLSAHSFGIALDFYNPNEARNMYWLWQIAADKQGHPKNANKTYQEILDSLREENVTHFEPKNVARVPWSLVHAFESEGFIWGGKWYHYDTIHFEYRS